MTGTIIIGSIGYGYATLLMASAMMGLWWACMDLRLGDRRGARNALFASGLALTISATCFFLTLGCIGARP